MDFFDPFTILLVRVGLSVGAGLYAVLVVLWVEWALRRLREGEKAVSLEEEKYPEPKEKQP